MDHSLLSVKNLSVIIQGEKILEDISFEIKKGENLMIIGPNGAGKSVLIKSLLGFIPKNGEVIWQTGVKISYIPQGFLPGREMPITALEFLNLKKSDEKTKEENLTKVGLSKKILTKKIADLSGGEFQRLMIVWSLIGNPDILIFDEPTSGIDVKGEEDVYSLISLLNKERRLASILVTHDLSVVQSFAHNVLCINKQSVCFGAPEIALTPKTIHDLYGENIALYNHNHDRK